jgi:hypothetical protein
MITLKRPGLLAMAAEEELTGVKVKEKSQTIKMVSYGTIVIAMG